MNGRIEAGYDDNPFVTVEGIDGSGKTSLVGSLVAEWDDVIGTSEPSTMWTGKKLREILREDCHPLIDYFYFLGDRANHIEEVIKPALDDGQMVVSDRYADSTRAYQQIALEDEVPDPQSFIHHTMQPWSFSPDITIYLDVSVDTAMERLDGDEKYETEEFLRRVKSNYEGLNRVYDERIVKVNGEQSEEEVLEETCDIIRYYCGEAEQSTRS